MTSVSKRLINARICPILKISEDISRLRQKGMNIIDFSIGTPNFLPERHVYDAAKIAIDSDSGQYGSSRGNDTLIKAYLERLHLSGIDTFKHENIVVGNGAKHLLFSVMYSLFNEGDEILIPAPCWPTYFDIIDLVGAKSVLIKSSVKQDYKVTPEQLEQAITTKSKAILFNNPSNPTGSVYSKKEIIELAKILAKHDLWIISDDVYSSFIFDETELTHFLKCAPHLTDRIIKIDSLSKSYGMPGWRVGMLGAPVAVANAIVTLNSNSISSLPEVVSSAAIAALRGPQLIQNKMSKIYRIKRNITVDALSNIENIICPVPKGAFYAFPDISHFYGLKFKETKIENDIVFADELLRHMGVAVVPGSFFGESKSVRISYTCDEHELVEGLAKINKFINRLK